MQNPIRVTASEKSKGDTSILADATAKKQEPQTTELLRPCHHCGSTLGIVGEGKPPHVASLRCAECEAKHDNSLVRWLKWIGKQLLEALTGGAA